MQKMFDDAGELILGTRFKKLSDKFLDDVSAIYKNSEVEFEPSWFAVFFSLDKYGRLTMSEIAANLGVTQSAISQTVSSLEKKGFVKIETADGDKRVRFVSFTEKAAKLLSKIKPIWKIIKSKMREMLNEGENSKYMLEALSELEYLFVKKGLSDRVLESLKEKNYRVEKYKQAHFTELKRLTFSWIFDYGIPKIEFVNNLKDILNHNEICMVFRDRTAVAAIIILKNTEYNEIFLINKNDFNDKADAFLIQNMFDDTEREKSKIKIYLDSDNFDVKSLLKKNGCEYKETVKFSKDSKKLDVFEGVL